MSQANESIFLNKEINLNKELFKRREPENNAENTALEQEDQVVTNRQEEVTFFSENEAVSLTTFMEKYLAVDETQLENENLTEEERERLEDLHYLSDMEILIKKPEVMENRTAIEQNRAVNIHEVQENHALNGAALLERNRIVKLLKVDEMTRNRILQSNMTLKEVLDTYTLQAERTEIAKTGKEFLLTFRDMKDTLMKDPFLTAKEKAKRLYHIAKPYAFDILRYKELYADTIEDGERSEEIENLLNRFNSLVNFFETEGEKTEDQWVILCAKLSLYGDAEHVSAHKKMFGEDEDETILTKIGQKARRIDKRGAAEEKRKLSDKGLDASQLNGTYAIDRFLIKNFNNGGGGAAFLDKILSLSARERLFLYFLIEKNQLESPSAVDITISQLSYVPDEVAVTDKLQKGLFKKSIVWEKLEAGLEILGHREVSETINSMAAFGNVEIKSRKASDFVKEKEGNVKEEAELEFKIYSKEEERNNRLTDYLKALVACKDAVLKRDSASIFTRSKWKNEAYERGNRAKDAYDALKNSDLELSGLIDECYQKYRQNADNGYDDLPANRDYFLTNVESEYIDTSEKEKEKKTTFAVNQTLGLMSKVDKIPSFFGGGKGNSSIAAMSSLFMLNSFAGAALSIQGIMGAIAGITGAINLIKHMKSGIGMREMSLDIAKLGSTLASSAWAPIAGLGTLALGIPKEMVNAGIASGLNTAVTAGGQLLAVGGAAVASIKMSTDVLELSTEAHQHLDLLFAKHDFKKAIEDGKLTGDEAVYAENITKLRNRDLLHKEADSAVNIAMDAGSFAVSLASLFLLPAAPFIALGWGVLACGITVGTKIADYYANKHKKRKAVEEYLQLDNTDDLGLSEELDFLPDSEEKEEYRERMKEHMAAELGFASVDSLYKHMLNNYAEFIYNNLTNEDERVSRASAELIQSLGLKISFPKKKKGKIVGTRKPTIAQIANKLGS